MRPHFVRTLKTETIPSTRKRYGEQVVGRSLHSTDTGIITVLPEEGDVKLEDGKGKRERDPKNTPFSVFSLR